MGPSRDKQLGRPRTAKPQEESGRHCILFSKEIGNQSKAYGEFSETRQSSSDETDTKPTSHLRLAVKESSAKTPDDPKAKRARTATERNMVITALLQIILSIFCLLKQQSNVMVGACKQSKFQQNTTTAIHLPSKGHCVNDLEESFSTIKKKEACDPQHLSVIVNYNSLA
jgi:hypothetical protein